MVFRVQGVGLPIKKRSSCPGLLLQDAHFLANGYKLDVNG